MEAIVKTVSELLAAGDMEGALDRVRALEPQDPAGFEVGMAAIAAARHDTPGCLAHAERAWALAPDDPIALQYLAAAHGLAGDPEAAERFARQAANRDMGSRSHAALGNVLLSAGKAEDAEAAYRAALDRDPGCAQALNGVATARWRRGDQATALSYFARAYQAEPEDPAPLRSILQMYGEAGWALGALALARTTASGYHAEEVHVALDLVLLHLGRTVSQELGAAAPQAEGPSPIEDLVARAAGRPHRVQVQLCRSLFDLGEVEASRSLLRRLGEETLAAPDEAGRWYVEGLLLEQAGDPSGALEAYEESLVLDGARWDACCNAIHLLLVQGGEEALGRVPALLERVPGKLRAQRPQLVLNEAIWLGRVGRPAEARAKLEGLLKVLGTGPLHEVARGALADLDAAPI
jgi:tetratricopeptide (TPR) repeat protein